MTAAIPVIVERDNVNDETVVLTRWFVSSGERVEIDQLIAEIETSKATVEVHSPGAGFIRYTTKEGGEIAVGQVLCFIDNDSQDLTTGGERVQSSNGSQIDRLDNSLSERDNADPHRSGNARTKGLDEDVPSNGAKIRFSRRAEELAKERDLRPEMFAPRMLVRERDVSAILNGKLLDGIGSRGIEPEMRTAVASPSGSPPLLPHRTEHLVARKRAEIRQIAIGMQNSIASSVSVACPTRGIGAALRQNPSLSLSVSAVIIFEVSRLLRKYPMFNAAYRPNVMCLFDQVNIGFAVDDGRGLKVPVIRECDRLSLAEVSQSISDLTIAYVDDKLSPERLTGSTFTVSDLSGLGVSHFTPLINGDQSAILGICSEVLLPHAKVGVYHLTLVFDHQLADGRTAALFLNELKQRLQSYENSLDGVGSEREEQLSCTRCLRSSEQLGDLGAYLLRSASPNDYVCSFCVLGY